MLAGVNKNNGEGGLDCLLTYWIISYGLWQGLKEPPLRCSVTSSLQFLSKILPLLLNWSLDDFCKVFLNFFFELSAAIVFKYWQPVVTILNDSIFIIFYTNFGL